MMKRDELEKLLNRFLKVEAFSDYCPNGLQVEGKGEIHKIALAVSANVKTIARAIEQKADALIVHHGLFWERDPYPICRSKRSRLVLLLEHRVSLFAYHLPLDAHPEVGNNWRAAQDLQWHDLNPFKEVGVMGTFPEVDIGTFVEKLESYYSHAATTALGGKPSISNAIILSGGGYKHLGAAAQAGADCFITGSFDEPAWHVAHEEGIHFIALGHAATERVGPKKLAEWMSDHLKIETVYLEDDNPF